MQSASAADAPVAVAVADLGSQITLPDGSTVLGPPDGIPDLIVADNGAHQNADTGPSEIVILPGLVDGQGPLRRLRLALRPGFASKSPLDLKVADLTGDGTADVVVVETGGVEVVFGQPLTLPPNDTPQTARNLGTVVHVVEPAQTIVPGHDDAYYTFTVPTEVGAGAGDEVLDFSGLFQAQGGAGLEMEVLDAHGHVLGSGARFQVVVPQGAVLTLHVFGVPAPTARRHRRLHARHRRAAAGRLRPGRGAAARRQRRPGGPTASLVLTFQGDRLDPATAEDPRQLHRHLARPRWQRRSSPSPQAARRLRPQRQRRCRQRHHLPDGRPTDRHPALRPAPAGRLLRDRAVPGDPGRPFNPDEDSLLAAAAGLTGHPVGLADRRHHRGRRRPRP